MPKGGARVPSDKYAVSKAMGLEYFFETLNLLHQENEKLFQITEVLNELNKKFAYWDDSKTETCRGTLKELWRFGFIEKLDNQNKKIQLNEKSWQTGSGFKYKISEKGKRVINEGSGKFTINVAKALFETLEKGIFPQLKKILDITKIKGYFPVSSTEHVTISKELNLYVEEHAGKSIKFGLLESTGIFNRKDSYFYLNHSWINELKINNFLFDDTQEKLELITEQNIKKSFIEGETLNILFKILDTKIISKNNVQINLFSNFNFLFDVDNIEIKDEILYLKLKSLFNSRDYTDSNILTLLGSLELNLENDKTLIELPKLRILTDDHEWELKICEIFNDLNFECLHLSGKSDRPDAILDLSNDVNHENVLEYLRNADKEKLMIETTIGEYSFSKLKKDTSKFINHSTKVLKISSIGQLIVASTFEKNIDKKFEVFKNEINHKVTLIDYENIIYLKKYKDHNNFKQNLKNLMISSKYVSKQLIDNYFFIS